MPGESTATFSFSYDGDVRTMTIDALGDAWSPADLPELPSGRWVHVAPLARHEFPLETIAALAKRRRVSLDGQGLVRAPRIGPLQLDDDFDRDLLRHVWILKLADEEAEVLGDPAALGVREVVVTHGSRGSTVYCGGRAELGPGPRLPRRSDRSRGRIRHRLRRRPQRGFSPAGAARRATAVVASLIAP